MTSEALPSSVDVVVLGTGLPEAVVAGACARSGLSVLHLDRNEYYGGDWSSFNLKSIEEWIQAVDKQAEVEDLSIYSSFLNEDERISAVNRRKTVDTLQKEWLPFSEAKRSFKAKDCEEETEISHRDFLEQKEWRRFSVDLAPKVLLSKGSMVRTLCDSEVSRYAEFKCVDRLLALGKDCEHIKFERVPCSKGEIFQNETLSVMDKRRLMKFLTWCMQWNIKREEMPDWKAFATRPFGEFLASQGISETLERYIVDAIGILQPGADTTNGLESVCRFMESVGHFGASPFLVPLYGCGELPQCFCRLCAVFGGLYCLGRSVNAFVYKDDRIVAVIADGQRVNCAHVIISNQYCDKSAEDKEEWIERAVIVTNRSILQEEKEHISLLNLHQLDPRTSPRLLEQGWECCTASKGYYICHVTAKVSDENRFDDVIRSIWDTTVMSSTDPETDGSGKPEALWSLRYRILSKVGGTCLPVNCALMDGPSYAPDFADVIHKAQSVFERFWPDRDFLPRSLKKPEDEEEEVVEQVDRKEDVPEGKEQVVEGNTEE